MGMYDYLGGEQIKIFYAPIFSPKGMSMNDKAGTWHSGGKLCSYGVGDELPLKTLYYHYPQNFLVYDYRFEYEDVWVIENGTFERIVSYKDLENSDMVGPVLDYYGRELNIKKVEDFSTIKVDEKECHQENKKIELEMFPNGLIHTIKNNYDEFKKKEKEWEAVSYGGSKRFSEKWFTNDTYRNEKKFGEAIDSLRFHWKERNKDESNYKMYVECAEYTKSLIDNNPHIIPQYKQWLNNEEMLDAIEFNTLIKEVMNTVSIFTLQEAK